LRCRRGLYRRRHIWPRFLGGNPLRNRLLVIRLDGRGLASSLRRNRRHAASRKTDSKSQGRDSQNSSTKSRHRFAHGVSGQSSVEQKTAARRILHTLGKRECPIDRRPAASLHKQLLPNSLPHPNQFRTFLAGVLESATGMNLQCTISGLRKPGSSCRSHQCGSLCRMCRQRRRSAL
jgi:hypothetical protein